MQSAVRFDAEVGEDRVIRLPAEVPVGPAEIIVLVSSASHERPPPGIAALVGILRTANTAPSDDEVEAMLDEARTARGGR